MTKLLDTLKDDIHDNKATLETLVVEGIQSIESVMKNMKNINSFMIMTINRCIDYTKASKGIVLVAKHSSFPLAEALELPHNCMKDMQESQTKIERAVISKDICSHVITDKQWLQENVLCLLSNASKYSSHGVVTVTVSLSTINDILEPCNSPRPFDKSIDQESNGDKDNRLILIEVEDNGIGIAPEIRGKLFNPFKQAQRLAGGTGLGLYSLAKRVEALNGYYGVNDRKDGEQGSLIWFAIPYRPDPMTARALLNSNVFSNGTLRTINSKPMHVLIVDDAVSITKMCGKMLKQLGHFVDTAENGAVAVDRVTEKWKCFYNPSSSTPREEDITHPFYDLILMDLQMPIMDGLEATRRIRKFQTDRETDTSCCHANSYSPRSLKSSLKSNTNISRPVFVCTTKIIGLSANSDHETTRLAYLAGVDAFIPKPFTIQAVDEVMQKWSGV